MGRFFTNSRPNNSRPKNSRPSSSRPNNSRPNSSRPKNSRPNSSRPKNKGSALFDRTILCLGQRLCYED
jgi:hypothetical protein